MKNNITPEEIALIKSAKAGSELAFSKIFKRYKPFVEGVLLTYIKDEDEAKDIANIVFLKVFDKISKFTNYNTFGGWLRILTKNVAIDYLRTVKQTYSLQEGITANEFEECSDDTEKAYINRMTYEKLVAMFDKLPPSYRDACRLFYVENMPIAEISKALGVPKGTIKSDLHRMRKIIRKHLKLTDHDKPNQSSDRSSRNSRDQPIQQEQ